MTSAPELAEKSTSTFGGRLVSLLVLGATVALVESVFALSKGWLHDIRYFLLSGALTLGYSAVVGALGAAFLGTRTLAAIWVLGAGWMVGGPIAGTGMALVVWVIWRWGAGRESLTCAAAGGGFALAFLLDTRVASSLGFLPLERSTLVTTSALAVHLVVFGALVVMDRLLKRRTTLRVAPLGFVMAVAALPALSLGGGKRHAEPSAPALHEQPNVFVLVLDTVRADRLGVYGHERANTPRLSALLEERPNGVRYDFAFSNGTWTVPSHASLFTGELPSQHGAQFGRARTAGFSITSKATLAEGLRQAEYETIGVFGNYWLKRVEGMSRGFSFYQHSSLPHELPLVGEKLRFFLVPTLCALDAKGGAGALDVNRRLLEAIDRTGKRPLYVFANYLDAHQPYTPPRGFRGEFGPWSPFDRPGGLALDLPRGEKDRLALRYDEEILALDHHIGQLLDALEARGLLENAWIFITSDHGEAFGEHGVTEHGTTVYNEVTRVPLLVFPPLGVELPEDRGPVSLVDVPATIAGVAGFSLEASGRDLREPDGERVPLVEFYGDPSKAKHGPLALEPAQAVIRGRFKLVHHAGRFELYDLSLDPLELEDRALLDPEVVDALRSLLVPLEVGDIDAASWDEVLGNEDLEALQDLGYLGGD